MSTEGGTPPTSDASAAPAAPTVETSPATTPAAPSAETSPSDALDAAFETREERAARLAQTEALDRARRAGPASTTAPASTDKPDAITPPQSATPASSTVTTASTPTADPAVTAPEEEKEEEKDPSWLAQFEKDTSALQDIKRLSKKAADKDDDLWLRPIKNQIIVAKDKDGKEFKKNIFEDDKTHVELGYHKRSVGSYKNIRDVDIDVKKGPAVVSLAATNSKGKKINGKALVVEFDKDGKAVGTNIDFRLVKYDRTDPPVAFINDKNGEKIILPINGVKLQKIKLEIETHKAKYKTKDKEVAKEKAADTPLPAHRISESELATIRGKTDKTPDDIQKEFTDMLFTKLSLEASYEALPDEISKKAFEESERKCSEFQSEHSGGEKQAAMLKATEIAKQALQIQAQQELKDAQKAVLEAKAKGDEGAEKEANNKLKVAEEKLIISGINKQGVDELKKGNQKEILGDFVREELAEMLAGRNGDESRKKQKVAADEISPTNPKGAIALASKPILFEGATKELQAKIDDKDPADHVYAQEFVKDKLRDAGEKDETISNLQHQCRLRVIKSQLDRTKGTEKEKLVREASIEILGSKKPGLASRYSLDVAVGRKDKSYDQIAPDSTPRSRAASISGPGIRA
jgi:hypothetical protein